MAKFGQRLFKRVCQMNKKAVTYFNKLSVFKQILFSFIIIIVIPAILSLFISFKTTQDLIISQAYKDALSSTDIVSMSMSNVINEIKNATLYLSNNETTMDYFTIMNKNKNELEGNELVSLLDLLRKLEGICDSVFFTRGINADFTLLSASGNIAYSNRDTHEIQFRNYLKKFDSEFIKNIGSSFKYIGLEKAQVTKDGKISYFLTWVKTVDSKYLTATAGIIIVNVPVEEIIKLMKTESVSFLSSN